MPSSWANLMTSACWALTARMTISCWPLRVVPAPPARGPLAVAGRRGVGGGGSSVPEDLHALEEQLDARAVEAGDDRERVVARVHGDDRELVGGEADDHVDVVAGLDDRADAGDLVDLDRDRAQARRARRCRGSGPVVGRTSVGRDLRAGRDRLADDLADDLGRITEGAGAARSTARVVDSSPGRP